MIRKKPTLRTAKKKKIPRKAKKGRKISFTDVRDQLGAVIKETRNAQSMANQLRNEMDKMKAKIDGLEGQQEALTKLFLHGDEMTLQEAFDQNLHGLKEASK